MVTIVCLSASARGVVHEATLLPFMRTEQARHWPSPQPYFGPVSPRSSRSTSSRGRSGSVVTVRAFPFTVNRTVAILPLWTKDRLSKVVDFPLAGT